jgi:hypothetical protein
MELPQILNVSVTFTPILNELPSLSKHRGFEGNDRRGILISNDIGRTENFIQRIYNRPTTTFFSDSLKKFSNQPFKK